MHLTSQILTAAGVLLVAATFAHGQRPSQEGIVRLGHTSEAPCDADACLYGACGTGCPPAGCPCGASCPCGDACQCGECQYGPCPSAVCGYGTPCGHCGCHEELCHLLNWLSPYHSGCTHPPDHGWAPPLKRPICRLPVRYHRYFPTKWTGERQGVDPKFRYPMAYMPTDTTQLGYYYQQAPTWAPNPWRVPRVPHPAEWHTPDFGCRDCGPDHNCGSYGMAQGPWNGVIIEGDMMQDAPADQSQPSQPLAPPSEAPGEAPPPALESAPVPPAEALEKSAAAPNLYPVPSR